VKVPALSGDATENSGGVASQADHATSRRL